MNEKVAPQDHSAGWAAEWRELNMFVIQSKPEILGEEEPTERVRCFGFVTGSSDIIHLYVYSRDKKHQLQYILNTSICQCSLIFNDVSPQNERKVLLKILSVGMETLKKADSSLLSECRCRGSRGLCVSSSLERRGRQCEGIRDEQEMRRWVTRESCMKMEELLTAETYDTGEQRPQLHPASNCVHLGRPLTTHLLNQGQVRPSWEQLAATAHIFTPPLLIPPWTNTQM